MFILVSYIHSSNSLILCSWWLKAFKHTIGTAARAISTCMDKTIALLSSLWASIWVGAHPVLSQGIASREPTKTIRAQSYLNGNRRLPHCQPHQVEGPRSQLPGPSSQVQVPGPRSANTTCKTPMHRHMMFHEQLSLHTARSIHILARGSGSAPLG